MCYGNLAVIHCENDLNLLQFSGMDYSGGHFTCRLNRLPHKVTIEITIAKFWNKGQDRNARALNIGSLHA